MVMLSKLLLILATLDYSMSYDPLQASECNKTAYEIWYNTPYNNNAILRLLYREFLLVTRSDTRLWKVLDLDNVNEEQLYSFTLSKGQVIELTAVKCKESFHQLTLDLAGMHGPVSEESIYNEMCNSFCTTNNKLRSEALEYSDCSCMELPFTSSSIPDNEELLNVTNAGGWCRENSGRILCNALERCGIWNCALDDFHCPRREYETYYGSCSDAFKLLPSISASWSIAFVLFMHFFLGSL